MNLRKPLFGASLLVAQPLLLSLLSLPATAYTISVLGAHDYGQWGIALALTLTSAALTNLGTRSYFVRRVAQDPGCAPAAFGEHVGVRAALGFGAGLVATLSCIALRYPAPVVICTAILTLSTILTAITTSVSDLLQATERLPAMATINLAAGLMLIVSTVVVMYFKLGLIALAFSYVAGPLVAASLALLLVHRRIFPVAVTVRPHRVMGLLRECRFMGFQQLAFTAATQAENLMVPKLVGIADYGYFAAGTLLPKRMELIPDALSTAFYPIMVKQYRDRSPHALRTVKIFIGLAFFLCIPPAVIVYFLADPIANILFKSGPEMCALVTKWTVWVIPMLGLVFALGYSLNASGREVQETKIIIKVAILGLVSSFLLVWFYGIMGACISMLVRQALGIVFRVRAVLRTVSSTPDVAIANVA